MVYQAYFLGVILQTNTMICLLNNWHKIFLSHVLWEHRIYMIYDNIAEISVSLCIWFILNFTVIYNFNIYGFLLEFPAKFVSFSVLLLIVAAMRYDIYFICLSYMKNVHIFLIFLQFNSHFTSKDLHSMYLIW